jgi:hypothetical protein
MGTGHQNGILDGGCIQNLLSLQILLSHITGILPADANWEQKIVATSVLALISGLACPGGAKWGT